MNRHLSTPLVLSFTLIVLFFTGCAPEVPDPQGPKITDIFPTAAGGGDTITIYGENLLADKLSSPKVTINNKLATIVLATNDSFRVVIPKKAGSGPVALITKTSTYTGPVFTYNYVAVVTTIAGTGAVGKNDGAGSQATFNHPWGITADVNGDLYVADSYNRLIRKISAGNNVVSTIHIPTSTDTAAFYSPYNITLDVNTHSLYLTDFNSHVLKVPAGLPPVTIYNGEMPLAGIAIGPDHHLYVGNNINGYILKMDTSGQNSSYFASGLVTPRNIIFDKAGTMYVPAYVHGAGGSIHKIDPAGNIGLVAIDTTFFGWEIARDTLGNFYEADHFFNRIRKIDTQGNITTIAGNWIPADIDGTGLNASFDGPTGITIDREGNLYVTTYNSNSGTGNKVRKIVFE